MKQHGIIVAIVIFALIIVGMFTFAFLKRSELSEAPVVTEPASIPQPSPYDSITRIDAKHFFENGTHTVVGELLLPTMCDLLNWDTVIRESMPEQVTIAFAIVNNAETCAQAVAPQRFLVTWNASESASIDATINGRKVELNLIPAAPGERPDDFELYIKG
jgi:hypothetical protein